MYISFKKQILRVFSENEWPSAQPNEVVSKRPDTAPEAPPVEPKKVELAQGVIDEKQGKLWAAREKTIAIATEYEAIANKRVDQVLNETKLMKSLPPEERRQKIQELIRDFLAKYQPLYEAEKKRLSDLWTDPAEMTKLLEAHENSAFTDFLEQKQKEMREKRQKERIDSLLKSVKLGDEEAANRILLDKAWAFSYDYKSIRNQILERHPEYENDKDALKKAIDDTIVEQFRVYCAREGIELEDSLLETNTSIDSVDDEADSPITLKETASIMIVQERYIESAKELSKASQDYQEEIGKYDRSQQRQEQDSTVSYYSAPEKIDRLPPGETTTFVTSSPSGWDVVYEAYREPDGEYTLSFGNHTLKNLPKKEVDVIVDINTIPVINSIFSVNSVLYTVLLKEYSTNCRNNGTDPLENPPLGFVEFLYMKLNDAYLATSPENGDKSLLWSNLSDMTTKDRWYYIRSVLEGNMWVRAEVLERLRNSKILIGGKINLAQYPR